MDLRPTDGGFGAENTNSSTDWTDQTVLRVEQVEQIIVKIFAPCILAVGAFGNIATICVMRCIKDHNSSQHAILMTLAVSDFLLIQTGMWRRLLQYYFHIDIRLWHSLVCKLYIWLLYVTGMLSAWLVTCVTVQRAMSITWPHKMRTVCTLRRTWIVIASVVCTSSLLNIHLLVVMEITGDNVCDLGTVEYLNFVAKWTWIDMFISSLIPSLCQIVCDVILCMALFKAASMSVTVQATSDVNAEHVSKSRRKTASNITVLCLALSFTFLILTLPICIEVVWQYFDYSNLTPRSQAKQKLIHSVLNILWYTNSVVNFFLYCISGTRFRKEFLNWICCRSQRHSTACIDDVTSETKKGRKANNQYDYLNT